jgi:hypothetical protein
MYRAHNTTNFPLAPDFSDTCRSWRKQWMIVWTRSTSRRYQQWMIVWARPTSRRYQQWMIVWARPTSRRYQQLDYIRSRRGTIMNWERSRGSGRLLLTTNPAPDSNRGPLAHESITLPLHKLNCPFRTRNGPSRSIRAFVYLTHDLALRR